MSITDARADAIHHADNALMQTLDLEWSRSYGTIDEVIAQGASIAHTLSRILTRIGTHFPEPCTEAQVDAITWAAQRTEEIQQALTTVVLARSGEEPSEPSRGPLKLSSGGSLIPSRERIVLTLEMMHEIARARFGPHMAAWRFVCPVCGSETAVGDFLMIAPTGAPGRECITCYTDAGVCGYRAYGLIPLAPWIVITPDGKNLVHFALAEAPSAPQTPQDDPDEVDTPEDADSPAAAAPETSEVPQR